ncbi:MAG TPA: D-alanyl-D-alanine carboxypeptidase family protein [Candidatus Limnocylindria bacterium]|nr:D-alanyl-D-alanine carboxypeptidase family protein [Candidatus Limnocylindria bacterium]
MKRWLTSLGVLLVLAACGSPTATPAASVEPLGTAPPIALATAAGGLGVELVAPGGSMERPDQPVFDATFRVSLVADHCTDRDLAAPPSVDPTLVVLDRSYGLDASYAPDDLVAASAAGLSGSSGTKLVSAVIVDDLADLVVSSRDAGLEIGLESAYRSYASQAATLDIWTARLGPAAALLRTARPGHSEHQLGTAIDFTSPGWSGRVGDWAVESVEGAWMAEHAWEFGFVMSYPPDAQPATCFAYEPWHYRWIGREAAAEQRTSGLDLRHFLERYAVP